MTCLGSPGTFTPQSNVVRDTDKSSKPGLMKLFTISFLRDSGKMNSGFAL